MGHIQHTECNVHIETNCLKIIHPYAYLVMSSLPLSLTLFRLHFLLADLFFYTCAPLNRRELNGRSKIWSENVERRCFYAGKKCYVSLPHSLLLYNSAWSSLAYLFPSLVHLLTLFLHMKMDNFSCLIMFFSHIVRMHIFCFVLIRFGFYDSIPHICHIYIWPVPFDIVTNTTQIH